MRQRVHALLSQLFRFALVRGYIEKSPLPKIFDTVPNEPVTRLLSKVELKKLWFAADKESVPIACFIRFLILTGQRISDVQNMSWEDVYLDLWRLGSDSHPIPLGPQAIQILRTLREYHPGTKVFCSKNAHPLGQVRRAINRTSNRAGISPSCSAQDLRRNFVSQLLELKINPLTVDMLIGKKSALPQKWKHYDFSSDMRTATLLWDRTVFAILNEDKKLVPIKPKTAT